MRTGTWSGLTLPAGLLLLATGLVGYSLRTVQDCVHNHLAVREISPLDYFFSRQSFCEIDNATATVDALALRRLTEIRTRCNPSVLKLGGRSCEIKVRVTEGIVELTKAMEKFKGHDAELLFARDLLSLLKFDRQYDRWLDLYFRCVYEHPTHRLVVRDADDAARISHLAGRNPELAEARKFLGSVPAGFETTGPD